MADLGLLDAWGLWLDGSSTIGHTLYGMPMVWVGRLGKIVAFVSALSALVDILGPERIRAYGTELLKIKYHDETKTAYVLFYSLWAIVAALAFVLLRIRHIPLDTKFSLGWFSFPFLILMTFGIVAVLIWGPKVMAWIIAKPSFATTVRILSLLGVVLGFHFDLLAS
ncbi:hypothetical protein ACQPYK_29570 [Streptosporangium sp. CA-135522]|uniref:hypothetical protein n=1 Tax=Streptosporangium sp. CA-135522 TaxID=3240072 RepID=UPI003D940DA6